VNRWLLNNLTTWELGILIIGAFVLLALAGLYVVRRWFPSLQESDSNDVAGVILGVLAAIYGIVLAFVIVSLYEDFRKAGSDVRIEATALSKVYADSRGFSPTEAAALKANVATYIRSVIGDEWPAMSKGRESESTWRALDAFYTTLEHYQPRTTSQKVFYAETAGRLNDLAGAHRERLNDSEESLPTTFEILLVGGALLLLGCTFLFAVGNRRLHTTLVLAVAVLLGFNLLLALVLDYPFSGEVVVSKAPFTHGALAQFRALSGH